MTALLAKLLSKVSGSFSWLATLLLNFLWSKFSAAMEDKRKAEEAHAAQVAQAAQDMQPTKDLKPDSTSDEVDNAIDSSLKHF